MKRITILCKKNSFIALLVFSFFYFNDRACAQTASLSCNVIGRYNSNYFINNNLQAQSVCDAIGDYGRKIMVAVIDSCTFFPWSTDSCIYGYFNQRNYYSCVTNYNSCASFPAPPFIFQFSCTITSQMNGLVAMLSYIPQGNHILAYTYTSSLPTSSSGTWPSAVRNAFVQLGSNMLNTITDSVPFIFYVKKGFPSTMQETSGSTASDTLYLMLTMECLTESVGDNKNVEQTFNIFPNPAANELRIRNLELRIEEVEIYDVLGKKVFPSPLVPLSLRRGDERGEVINVSSFSLGIYFIHIKSKDKIFSQKVIISR